MFVVFGQIDMVVLYLCRNLGEVFVMGFVVREIDFIVEFVVFVVNIDYFQEIYIGRGCFYKVVYMGIVF